MTDIITGPGSYRTVDGRRIEIGRISGGYAEATNLECMESGEQAGKLRVKNSQQKYHLNGSVWLERRGEENDRIVGPWVSDSPVQEFTVRKIVAGSYRNVKVSGDGKQFGIEMGNYTAAELRDAARILNQVADFIDAS